MPVTDDKKHVQLSCTSQSEQETCTSNMVSSASFFLLKKPSQRNRMERSTIPHNKLVHVSCTCVTRIS